MGTDDMAHGSYIRLGIKGVFICFSEGANERKGQEAILNSCSWQVKWCWDKHFPYKGIIPLLLFKGLDFNLFTLLLLIFTSPVLGANLLEKWCYRLVKQDCGYSKRALVLQSFVTIYCLMRRLVNLEMDC